MPMLDAQTYVPVLRLKEGEYRALGELVPSVLDRILPHFILPPPKERDPELGRVLLPDEIVFIHARRVGTYWPLRTCLLDPRFLFAKLEVDTAIEWLPRLFKLASGFGARTIPVAGLRELEGNAFSAFQKAIHENGNGLALRLTLDEMNDAGLATRVQKMLLRLTLKPQECIILADFSGAELSSPETVAEIILSVFQNIIEIGVWRRVVFEASSYPDKNPTSAGGEISIPRHEWQAWKHAAHRDSEIMRHMLFGDFAADCSKFNFRAGGTAPIKHYRYTTPESWLVVRAAEDTKPIDGMKDVSSRIIGSGQFYGRSFSSADAYIEDTANGFAGPGSATTWRKVNTIHHLTCLVKDIGDMMGYKVADRALAPPPKQEVLF